MIFIICICLFISGAAMGVLTISLVYAKKDTENKKLMKENRRLIQELNMNKHYLSMIQQAQNTYDIQRGL